MFHYLPQNCSVRAHHTELLPGHISMNDLRTTTWYFSCQYLQNISIVTVLKTYQLSCHGIRNVSTLFIQQSQKILIFRNFEISPLQNFKNCYSPQTYYTRPLHISTVKCHYTIISTVANLPRKPPGFLRLLPSSAFLIFAHIARSYVFLFRAFFYRILESKLSVPKICN